MEVIYERGPLVYERGPLVYICVSSFSILGLCSVRTHTSPQVVNQLSRFHTSADIGSINNTSLPSHQSTQYINIIPIIVTPSQQLNNHIHQVCV